MTKCNNVWFDKPEAPKYECAICGHIIPTGEEEHARVGMEYICETCASSASKLLEWIGGYWVE